MLYQDLKICEDFCFGMDDHLELNCQMLLCAVCLNLWY